jgi:tetratricopeptide (TPR) repeat protein/tRNA A-37 threonylcarbamoyl transferase component Bud32
MEDLTGKTLGPYRIVASLGEGGMAAVYKAYQPGTDRHVALKVLPRQLANDPQFAARFQQEAQVIARLQHPHILSVFDYGTEAEYTYIAMPFVESGTLSDLLRGEPLPLSQIKTLVSQVGDALDYAHSRGIVHRDVKPSNVLVDERGNCLLTDFGIAKIVEGSDAAKLTGTGGVVGTPAYMSPEQGKGEKVDARSDIYSLGVILYEMATGRVPFSAETPIGIVFKHIQDPLPSPRAINPDIPESLEAVIARALAKQPADRYETAADMVLALQTALADEVVEAEPIFRALTSAYRTTSKQSPVETPKRLRPRWMFAVAGLALIALILFGAAAVAGGRLLFNTLAAGPTPPPTVVFGDDTYGVLLVAPGESTEARELMALIQRDVKARLGETGLGDEVTLAARVAASTESLDQIARDSRARVGILITTSPESNGVSAGLQTYFATEPDVTLQAMADALSSSAQSESLAAASAVFATRLGVLINASVGYDALHDGKYDECSRRFNALLPLLDQMGPTTNRAEAAHLALGTCLNALGNAEEGRAEYEKAIAINPNYSAAYFGLGNYWYSQGDYEQAVKFYQDTLSKAQVDPLASQVMVGRAYGGLGNIALAELRYDDALKAFDEAIKNQPDFPAYYLARALAKRGLGRETEAKDDFQACVEAARKPGSAQSDYFRQLEKDCTSKLDLNP